MNRTDAMRITPRLIVGLGILTLGLLWTLDNLDLIEADRITDWWPIIIVFAGLARFANPQMHRLGSGLIVLFGALLLLDSIDLIDVDFGDLFPLVIVLVGGKIVWDAMSRRTPPPVGSSSDDAVQAFAVMAGLKRQNTSSEFRGASLNAIMGGVELDLRGARIAEGQEAVIDAFAFWGGVEIRIPETWRVRDNVLPMLGGVDDKTHPTGNTGPVLHLRGTAIMGGIEVKN